MFIVVDTISSVILDIGTNIVTLDNGNISNIETHMEYFGNTAVIKQVDNIPEYVERYKYIYTSDNVFKKNTRYIEPFSMTESMYSSLQSNIDYLMLLTDADSASEEDIE